MAFIALLRSLTHAYQEGKHPGDSDIESMIPKLEADLGSSARVDTLRRLHDILREPNGEHLNTERGTKCSVT